MPDDMIRLERGGPWVPNTKPAPSGDPREWDDTASLDLRDIQHESVQFLKIENARLRRENGELRTAYNASKKALEALRKLRDKEVDFDWLYAARPFVKMVLGLRSEATENEQQAFMQADIAEAKASKALLHEATSSSED